MIKAFQDQSPRVLVFSQIVLRQKQTGLCVSLCVCVCVCVCACTCGQCTSAALHVRYMWIAVSHGHAVDVVTDSLVKFQ